VIQVIVGLCFPIFISSFPVSFDRVCYRQPVLLIWGSYLQHSLPPREIRKVLADHMFASKLFSVRWHEPFERSARREGSTGVWPRASPVPPRWFERSSCKAGD